MWNIIRIYCWEQFPRTRRFLANAQRDSSWDQNKATRQKGPESPIASCKNTGPVSITLCLVAVSNTFRRAEFLDQFASGIRGERKTFAGPQDAGLHYSSINVGVADHNLCVLLFSGEALVLSEQEIMCVLLCPFDIYLVRKVFETSN
jgi:hypothetical protein